MFGRTTILLRAALAFTVLAATAHATTYPLTLADGLGSTITIARAPARIISLAPNVTEILFAIGAGDRVVGVTRYCNYPPEAEQRTKVGGYTDIVVETILALSPDLVVASRGNSRRSLNTLSRHGLTVLAIDPRSVDDVKHAIARIGRVTDNEREAAAVCRDMDEILASVREAVAGVKDRRRVYFGSLTAPYSAAGPTSFIGGCIELAGGVNIAQEVREPWPVLSIETIIKRDPEVLIEGFHAGRDDPGHQTLLLERLRGQRVWSQTSAVRSGRVYVLNDDTIHRPGPRLARAVAEMARLLYPERFLSNGEKKPR